MLRAHLRDAAVAAAKARSHARVEPRHVAFAIARHFRDRPEVEALLARADQALGPDGLAIETPRPTAETAALLDRIRSEEDALVALRELVTGESGDGAEASAEARGLDVRAAEEGEAVEADSSVKSNVASDDRAPGETVADVLAELDRLVGLETVKEQVQRVIAVVQANQERAAAGLPTVNPGLHLVFSGAPGTGKTTVARLMARLYAASGALPDANFTEVDRSDLVAGYVGQTAIQTSKIIRETVPGVLFVDEAYALTPMHDSDFGAEAIATLVKAMEDHRQELAVIVAGYAREMSAFLAANPGLRSRLKTFIDFPDYDPAELVEIFVSFANTAGLHLAEGTLEKAEAVFERAARKEDFGNARFARTLFENAYARMALRAAADGEIEMNELTGLAPEDLEWVESGVDVKTRRIGFGGGPAESPENERP